MRNAWRPLALAAAISLLWGAGVATAQTVIVRNAPAGSTIELVVNADTVASTTADPGGTATLTASMFKDAGRRETDANLYVDVCPENRRRVIIVERGQPDPSQDVSCTRTQSLGLFLVRPISTFVVNVESGIPTVMLRQGSVSLEPRAPRAPVPTGFVVFGGAGLARFRDAVSLACGNVEDCSGDEWGITFAAGAEYWISRFLSAELNYVRRTDLEISGSGQAFRFEGTLDSHLTTITGKIGIPAGPARFYGKVGGNYLRATTGTTQTVDDTTVTIDGVEQTIEGGTIASAIDFSGWGWTFGGGVEGWVKPFLAIYAEGGLVGLKGDPRETAEGAIDDRLTYFVGGLRIRIGG